MSDIQPLTDEEANHYWMVRRPNCDCTACRAIARIRADGERIRCIKRAAQTDAEYIQTLKNKIARLEAALEDKTK